jgi:hypothetical protein
VPPLPRPPPAGRWCDAIDDRWCVRSEPCGVGRVLPSSPFGRCAVRREFDLRCQPFCWCGTIVGEFSSKNVAVRPSWSSREERGSAARAAAVAGFPRCHRFPSTP